MAMFAPEIPTTVQLESLHATDFDPTHVNAMRDRTSDILRNPETGLIVATGPCSLTGGSALLHKESGMHITVADSFSNVVGLYRRNIWKPRTDPEEWHGPETTDPEKAFVDVAHGAMAHANGAAEIATTEHVERYGKFLTFGWFGARNDKIDIQIEIARLDSSLPLGVKNDVTGNVDDALEMIQLIRKARGEGSAPVVLIYRGGTDATTPEAWEEQFKRANELTMGSMILDIAHGGEMAHDPDQNFKKTVLGQIACAGHAKRLAELGHRPAGYMMESSSVSSLTDPNMPFRVGLETTIELATIVNNRGEIR